MKSIATNALLREAARQGERLRKIGLGAMEGRVEAGDLRYLRRGVHDRADGGEVVRLMQRCERLEFGEVVEHGLGHPHRRRVAETAVDHAMTEADNRPPLSSAPPCSMISRVTAPWSKPCAAKVRSSMTPPLSSAILSRGATVAVSGKRGFARCDRQLACRGLDRRRPAQPDPGRSLRLCHDARVLGALRVQEPARPADIEKLEDAGTPRPDERPASRRRRAGVRVERGAWAIGPKTSPRRTRRNDS